MDNKSNEYSWETACHNAEPMERSCGKGADWEHTFVLHVLRHGNHSLAGFDNILHTFQGPVV